MSEKATLTVRVIKSFEYKNFRPIVFHDLDLHKTTLAGVRDMVWERTDWLLVLVELLVGIRSVPALKQYEKCQLDTFKMYYHAHGAKTNNPMINVGGDEALTLDDYTTNLHELGFRHETEISYFNKADYEKYRANPVLKW